MTAKTITERFGSGGANLTPSGTAGEPTLAEVLREAADSYDPANGLQAGVVVATHTATLPVAGMVLWVESTTGSTTGRCVMGTSAPATLECQVAYDGDGIPTLTFNATDAVTACDVQQLISPITKG